MKVQELLTRFEQKAPFGTAEDWDPVGLLVGDPKKEITGVVVSVDLSRSSFDLAVKSDANVIVNHHPCIFPKQSGISRLVPGRSDDMTTLMFEAVQKGIQIIALHTNFDRCAMEVVQKITAELGAKPVGRLVDSSTELLKLVIYVPETHIEKVRDAIHASGAGVIGNYDQCSFSVSGEGRFRGLDGSNPFLGKPGVTEKAKEVRLETVLPAGLKKQVLKAMHDTHPYEEVAYDLYALEQKIKDTAQAPGLGYGFVADLPAKIPFTEFTAKIKSTFEVQGFYSTPAEPGSVKRIGYVPGKGSSFINNALSQGCDVFVTGEVGYHLATSMSCKGLTVIELGHRHSEIYFPRVVSEWCESFGLKTHLEEAPTQKIW
ncbi:MAG: Nif3-like dinuclear metal center hexameric protein [Xanthomonadaceae bacterium]|nr:Nif3-like dinuclear metal center hexameric protein [Xanthomonadaceae bacterium]